MFLFLQHVTVALFHFGQTFMKHPFIAALAASLLCAPVFAADRDRPGRFTIDVKIDGTGHQANGRETARFTTEESTHTAFTLIGSGVPEDSNRLDIAGNAAVMQKQVDEANARAPSREQQKAIMERAKEDMAACKGDMGCLTRIGQALGVQTASWAPRPASPGANAGRFLSYSAAPAAVCKPDYQVKIRRDDAGKSEDVQGLVPFTHKTSADFKANALQSTSLCLATVVVDTKTNAIFVSLPWPEVSGKVVRKEGSHTVMDYADTGVRLSQDALDWVAKTLNGAARSGKQRTTLKIPTSSAQGGTGEKTINVEMSWNFDAK